MIVRLCIIPLSYLVYFIHSWRQGKSSVTERGWAKRTLKKGLTSSPCGGTTMHHKDIKYQSVNYYWWISSPLSSPLWLTIPAVFATRPHACASLQTCMVLHAVTQLFACWGHSGPLNALNRLGVGLGWLYSPKWTPSLFSPQFLAEARRRSYWVAPTIERIGSGCASNPMRVLISLTAPCDLHS